MKSIRKSVYIPDSLAEMIDSVRIDKESDGATIVRILAKFFKLKGIVPNPGVRPKVRRSTVSRLIGKGLSDLEISQRLNCHQTTVWRIRKRLKNVGT